MAKNNNLGDFLTDIANAIRNKKGSVGTINAQDFSTEIASIQTGTFEGGSSVNGYTLTFNSSCSYQLNTIESDGSSHLYEYSKGYSGTIQNVVYCIIKAQYTGMPYIQKNSGSAKIIYYDVNSKGTWRQMNNFEWITTNLNVLIKLESDCSFVIGDDD